MELLELNLAAFGPFRDRLLDFSPSGGGLHIVYGANEAGKSSSLRGLKALLFGIPSRTNDNFLHENKALRIGGKLCAHDGQVLEVVRRKGNKNTLLSPQGAQLDDTVLSSLLHGVTAEIFEMLFGIDHAALVKGGEEILQQKGEVGQALFSASMGSAALHGVLEQMEREADELFKPRGSTQAINAALKTHAELRKAIKAQSLSSREWGEARRALERTDKDLDRVQEELAQRKADRNRLERIRRALPKIATRREFQQQLEELGAVVVLPADFGKRRQVAVVALEKAQATSHSATSDLNRLQEQIKPITVRTEVLELTETIENLHARLGGHQKAMQDRPHLDAERSQQITDAGALLRVVRPELAMADTETLSPAMTKGARIAELGNQQLALTDRATQTAKELRESKARLMQVRTARAELTEAGSAEALREQITLARKQGDLDATLRSGRGELESLEKACRDDLSRLSSLWHGTLDQLPGLPLPARESIDRFEQDNSALAQRIQRLGDKQDEHANTAREAQTQLDEIRHGGAVPTEQTLLDSRAGRDTAWGLIRRQWLDGEDVDAERRELDPDHALPEAFESRVIDADELADRLRREAVRVQKQASLLSTLDDVERRTEECSREREAFDKEQRRLDTEWAQLWKPSAIQPLSPREMRAWLDNMEKLQARITQLDDLRRRSGDVEESRKQLRQALEQELKRLGEELPATESLEALLVASEAVVGKIEELARERQSQDKEIQTLEQRMEAAQLEQQEAIEKLKTWKGQWQTAVGGLGLGADALPAEANEMLESIRSLLGKQSEAEKLRIRIEGIDTDAGGFRNEVASVVQRVAPELAKLSTEEAVARLARLLGETGKEETRRQQLEKQILEAQKRINTAEATHETMTERLDALCKEASCKEATELEPAERRSSMFQEFKRKIETLEQELREIGEGMTLTDLETEAQAADPDTLPGKIEALTDQIEKELEPQKTDLAVTKGAQQEGLNLMDGSDAAAAAADEAQSVLVGIRSNAEQYVRLRLASRILRDEIESYRRQHQGPLLERASEHFAVLTQGSFAGLQADFNEKDEPVLVGVRPDDEKVFVDGMSSGTRDQLYLALRLASLEKYMESSEPMPFIVDDILVHFDDDRSRATLGVLAELAQKTQIIMFTHHRRLVEQAQTLDTAVPVTVHEL